MGYIRNSNWTYRTLSRYSAMTRAQTIERMPYERRIATLVVFAIMFTTSSQDDVIDMSERKRQKTRLRTLKDLDKAARKLREACSIILDESNSEIDIKVKIFSKISKDELELAIKKSIYLQKLQIKTLNLKSYLGIL